jgi:hypothetical protein
MPRPAAGNPDPTTATVLHRNENRPNGRRTIVHLARGDTRTDLLLTALKHLQQLADPG